MSYQTSYISLSQFPGLPLLKNENKRLKHIYIQVYSHCGARLGASHVFCPVCGNRIEKKNAQDRENRRQRALPIDKDTLLLLKEYIDLGGPVEKEGKRLIIGVNRHRAWQIVRECAEKASLPKLVNPETGRIHNISPTPAKVRLRGSCRKIRRFMRWSSVTPRAPGTSELQHHRQIQENRRRGAQSLV
jgi:uncharacterized Zn finger protein (UPF0148 family)